MVHPVDIHAEWDDMLAHVPVSPAEKSALRARMGAADRHYHDMRHCAVLWARHKAFGAGTSIVEAPWHQRLACAIAYHDSIYVPARKDNETRSAALWRAAQPEMDDEGFEWVAGTIGATSNHLAAAPSPNLSADAWAARLWMLDLDLTPLGETSAIFDANTLDLRREFAHLAQTEWETRRVGFLKGMLAYPALFRTPVLNAAFEAQARTNLTRATGG
jgi:predicted metal-dependent HD superfamily phosphohydrolase